MGGRQRRGMRRRTAQDKERSRRHSFRPVQPAPRYTMHDEVGSIENRIVTANLANSMALRLSRLQSYSAAQGPHDLRLSVPLLDLPSQGPSLGVDCRAHLLPPMSPHQKNKSFELRSRSTHLGLCFGPVSSHGASSIDCYESRAALGSRSAHTTTARSFADSAFFHWMLVRIPPHQAKAACSWRSPEWTPCTEWMPQGSRSTCRGRERIGRQNGASAAGFVADNPIARCGRGILSPLSAGASGR